MKAVTVRLDDDVHRAVKVRAAQEGVAMETLARAWFRDYAIGGLAVGDTQSLGGFEQPQTVEGAPVEETP